MNVTPFNVLSWQKQADKDDRSLAIVGAALIDAELARLLRSFFIADSDLVEPLLKAAGPLSDFDTRARLVHALGLLGPYTVHDVDVVRQIRNRFAHESRELSFDTSEIADRCRLLNYPKRDFDVFETYPNTPRGLFARTVEGILWAVAGEALQVEQDGHLKQLEDFEPVGRRENPLLRDDDEDNADLRRPKKR